MKIKLHSWDENLYHVVGKTLDDIADEGVKTHAFLMMNNHYHWICDFNFPKDPGLPEWFHELLNMEFILHLDREYNESDLLPHMPAIYPIKHIKQYRMTYKYIYRNPVDAGLVSKVEDYSYSTLPYVLGRPGLPFVCFDHMNAIYSSGKILRWLNQGDEFLELNNGVVGS